MKIWLSFEWILNLNLKLKENVISGIKFEKNTKTRKNFKIFLTFNTSRFSNFQFYSKFSQL